MVALIKDRAMRKSAFHWIALAVLVLSGANCYAIGLGSIQVRSGLGQPLRASIPIIGADSANVVSTCIKSKIESSDGVYLTKPQVVISRDVQPAALLVSTNQSISEPAVMIYIEIGCTTPIQRNYQILLDPVESLFAQAKPQLAARVDPARQAASDPMSAVSSQSSSKSTSKSKSSAQLPREKISTRQKSAKISRLAAKQNTDYTNSSNTARAEVAAAPVRHRKEKQSVLRLSGGLGEIEPQGMLGGMKMSDSLSGAIVETDADKISAMRSAQVRFAAILRGEDPDVNAEIQTNAIQKQIQSLQLEAEQIRQQSAEDKIVFEALQKKSVHFNVLVGVTVLFLIILVAVIWLALRLYHANKVSRTSLMEHEFSIDDEIEDDPTLAHGFAAAPDFASMHEEQIPEKSTANLDSADTGSTVKSDAATLNQSDARKERDARTVIEGKAKLNARRAKRSELLKVEEISDAMQEAEFWISLQNPERAISVLEPYSDVERPNSPLPWLYLLDLYRGVGDRAKYDALVVRFRGVFNSKVPPWERNAETEELHGLEDMPELVERICALWGTSEVTMFLENIMFDNRDGERDGFDLPVYRDIILLTNIAYDVQASQGADYESYTAAE